MSGMTTKAAAKRDGPKVVSISRDQDYTAQVYVLDKSGGGGGDDGWRSSVDDQLKMLHADVRNLLIGGVSAVVLLLSIFVYGFLTLNGKNDQIINSISSTTADQKVLVERLGNHLEDVKTNNKPTGK